MRMERESRSRKRYNRKSKKTTKRQKFQADSQSQSSPGRRRQGKLKNQAREEDVEFREEPVTRPSTDTG